MDIFDIALALTPRVGGQTAAYLIDKLFSAQNIFAQPYENLIQNCQLNPQIATAIVNRVAMEAAEKELEYCAKNSINAIAATDPQYPSLLREISNPPHIIYTQGDRSILTKNLVAFVGTRKITPYGERACTQIIEQLAAKVHNLVIVSGLAHGVDSAAHRAALSCGVPTIAIIPTPLPSVTPATNATLARSIIEAGGALISEYPSFTNTAGRGYISRNRIIAGVSAATIIVESAAKGGSMHTAEIANSEKRVVGAVPGRITDNASVGCNNLISQQLALPITSAEDIIRALNWGDRRIDDRPIVKSDTSQFSDSLLSILKLFTFDEPLHISHIEQNTQMPIGQIMATLMELEILGAIKALPGSRYERIISLEEI